MIRWMAPTAQSTSRVGSQQDYFLLASSGRRPIQNRLLRKVVETSGAESSCEAISPRWMKICSSSVIPVDWPAVASVGTGSTLKASIVLTVADLLEGENTSRSPTLIRPAAMRPVMIRRASNLYTSCTGKRKVCLSREVSFRNRPSVSNTVGPVYQGIWALGLDRKSTRLNSSHGY